MYGKASLAAPAGALPFTGLEMAWVVIAAVTLIFVGLSLLRFVPREEA